MKIALGTVQLGLPYGLNNLIGVPNDDEIKKIFALANASGINILDTAIAYGDAEEKIGKYANGNFNLITKLPAFPNKNYSYKWLLDNIEGSLKRLQTDSLYGILLHRPSQMLEVGGMNLFEDLLKLKNKGKVHKIGISIYEPSELDSIIGKFEIDIVQAPLSILDRRIISSGWLSRLYSEGIEVHARSIFLQGLLLTKPEERNPKFIQWKSILTKYDDWLIKTGYTPLQACIGFVSSFAEVNYIVTGIDNSKHLLQIIEASTTKLESHPDEIFSDDIKLINPLSWLDF